MKKNYSGIEEVSTICKSNIKITKYFGTYSEFTRKKALLREDYIRQFAIKDVRKRLAGCGITMY